MSPVSSPARASSLVANNTATLARNSPPPEHNTSAPDVHMDTGLNRMPKTPALIPALPKLQTMLTLATRAPAQIRRKLQSSRRLRPRRSKPLWNILCRLRQNNQHLGRRRKLPLLRPRQLLLRPRQLLLPRPQRRHLQRPRRHLRLRSPSQGRPGQPRSPRTKMLLPLPAQL
jgi:hypothetical protein